MIRLFGLAVTLMVAPACVLAVNVHGNKLHGGEDDQGTDTDPFGEDHETDHDTDVAGDSAPEPALQATATLDPAEVEAGTVELVRLVATVDQAGAVLQGVSFDDRAAVLDSRPLDDGSWMLSVHAMAGAEGPVDLHLDYGTFGVATVPEALLILPASESAGGAPYDPTEPGDPSTPCE